MPVVEVVQVGQDGRIRGRMPVYMRCQRSFAQRRVRFEERMTMQERIDACPDIDDVRV